MIKPIMKAARYKGDNVPSVTVEIDDCDCKTCVENRGMIQAGSAIKLEVMDEEAGIMQMLSVEEATYLGQALLRFADKIKDDRIKAKE